MNKISTEKAIEVLYTVRAYYANLTIGYSKGEDCKGIEDVTCSEIANSCLMAIKVLEQEPKIGHWIRQTDEHHDYYYECDQCGIVIGVDDIKNFCPNCGAKMIKSQESEDKCSNCAKSWTDDCPRNKCWDNDYSEFIEESEGKGAGKSLLWRKCERCGKLIPYMANYCHECAYELLEHQKSVLNHRKVRSKA